VEFRARNFFARGGELYYLIISAGTEYDPERRVRIGKRLKALLTDNNEALGRIAQIIDAAWCDLSGDVSSEVSGTPERSAGSLIRTARSTAGSPKISTRSSTTTSTRWSASSCWRI
jgi:hypothetical protein